MTDQPISLGPVLFHDRAAEHFGALVHAVTDDGWDAPTPATEWSVRDLVAHLVTEALWAVPMLAGQTVRDVGDRFDGDVLGGDPTAAWDEASAAARAAVSSPGALDRTVHLSAGDSTGRDYVEEMATDLLIHSWDLAKAIGADDSLDPAQVRIVHRRVSPRADEMSQTGLFDPPVEVPDDADEQTRLLALFGRRR
jgi:uncharacterized protein (TIGR03086 family)